VIPVGEERRDQKLLRIRRKGDEFVTEDLGGVRFVPLVGGLPREANREH
jgi:protein-L-isoaspartate O-methyltransferase